MLYNLLLRYDICRLFPCYIHNHFFYTWLNFVHNSTFLTEHFNNINGTNGEYYYIKINNNIDFNSKTISYSTNPIRVILPNTNNTNNKSNIKKINDDDMANQINSVIFITLFI